MEQVVLNAIQGTSTATVIRFWTVQSAIQMDWVFIVLHQGFASQIMVTSTIALCQNIRNVILDASLAQIHRMLAPIVNQEANHSELLVTFVWNNVRTGIFQSKGYLEAFPAQLIQQKRVYIIPQYK